MADILFDVDESEIVVDHEIIIKLAPDRRRNRVLTVKTWSTPVYAAEWRFRA